MTPGWRGIPETDLRGYLTTGQPPQDVSPEKLAEYGRWAERIVQEANPEMVRLLALLPPDMRETFQAFDDERRQSAPAMKQALIANAWLRDKMAVLHVRPELRKKIDFQFGRMCAISDVWTPGMWVHAVAYHNGFCKTVLELKQHHRG